jgi:hypothetical protein
MGKTLTEAFDSDKLDTVDIDTFVQNLQALQEKMRSIESPTSSEMEVLDRVSRLLQRTDVISKTPTTNTLLEGMQLFAILSPEEKKQAVLEQRGRIKGADNSGNDLPQNGALEDVDKDSATDAFLDAGEDISNSMS